MGAMLKCAVYLDMRDNRCWRTGQHIPEQAELDGSVADAFTAYSEHIGVAPPVTELRKGRVLLHFPIEKREHRVISTLRR